MAAGKSPKLEGNLLEVMTAIDAQVARELQRTPAERESHGIQKWEPFEKRVESITAFILDCLGDESIKLDSVVVLAQAFSKTLKLVTEDLGAEGLGKIRALYVGRAAQMLEADASAMRDILDLRNHLS